MSPSRCRATGRCHQCLSAGRSGRTSHGCQRRAPARRRAAPGAQTKPEPLRVRLTARHAVSQLIRKRIEELIGRCKTTDNFRKSRYRGVERTNAQGQYAAIACNLVRRARLMITAPPEPVRA